MLGDRVIVREWVQNKSHRHVHESRTFSKGLTWCKLTITLICKTLMESRNHLVFGHSSQTLTTGIVRMLYPWKMKHIHNKLRCDYNSCTSNVSRKERYWKIESMHVGVKLLDQHGWTNDWNITQWLSPPTMNDSGKVSVSEVRQNDSTFRMNTSSRKFSEKSFRASSSRNRRWEGVGLEEDDALEQRGFWDGVDLRLGAIDTTNINNRKRGKKETIRKIPKAIQI